MSTELVEAIDSAQRRDAGTTRSAHLPSSYLQPGAAQFGTLMEGSFRSAVGILAGSNSQDFVDAQDFFDFGCAAQH